MVSRTNITDDTRGPLEALKGAYMVFLMGLNPVNPSLRVDRDARIHPCRKKKFINGLRLY